MTNATLNLYENYYKLRTSSCHYLATRVCGPSISVLRIESASKRPGVMLENYYRELVCFLNAKLGNRQVAEDVVHDAYVRVLERSSDTPIEQPRAFSIAPR
jgi:hypothetical protein